MDKDNIIHSKLDGKRCLGFKAGKLGEGLALAECPGEKATKPQLAKLAWKFGPSLKKPQPISVGGKDVVALSTSALPPIA